MPYEPMPSIPEITITEEIELSFLERIGNAIENAWDSVTGSGKEEIQPENIIEEIAENNGKSIEEILEGATEGRATKGKTTQYEKDGGFDKTTEDFNDLKPTDVKEINTRYGQGSTGKLPDGRSATSRPGSTDGRPTLEIRNPENGRGIEIRYNN